jgi:hypothetical protein
MAYDSFFSFLLYGNTDLIPWLLLDGVMHEDKNGMGGVSSQNLLAFVGLVLRSTPLNYDFSS